MVLLRASRRANILPLLMALPPLCLTKMSKRSTLLLLATILITETRLAFVLYTSRIPTKTVARRIFFLSLATTKLCSKSFLMAYLLPEASTLALLRF